jgi:putative acyl-CoA dehydrogenase
MRAALSQAIHHTRHRHAFGGLLADKPAMRAVLADLAVESEAATVLALRLAGAVDRREDAFRRLAIAAGKYWVCKRQPAVVGEALECLGGNGYVEESGLPRLYRDAPLNSIWEGSGNVQALDVLRAVRREPDSLDAFRAEVARAAGADRRLDDAAAELDRGLAERDDPEGRARWLVERMALVLQGSLLVRHAPAPVADMFCATRLAGDWGHAFGTLPSGLDAAAIVNRAAPG